MSKTDYAALARELGPQLAAHAAENDANDTFVAQNFAILREHGFFAAAVPEHFGGGGADERELSAMLREIAHYCSSTALALSMHTHQVATPAWRLAHEGAPTEGLLRRVATEPIVLVNSGASDWLDSSGVLTPTDGGFRFSGRKAFASGSPAGTLMLTSGVLNGDTVLHFAVPLTGSGVTILDTWRAHGMRGTGSNDIVFEAVFIPEAAIMARRPKGTYGVLHTIVMIALPLVYSAYVGIAEAARDLAVRQAAKNRDNPEVQLAVGELDRELRAAQIALDRAVDVSMTSRPGPETSNEIFIARQLAGQGAIRTVERAMEVYGGASFFRAAGFERLWRDVQGARFHPLPTMKQETYSGRLALGLPLE